MANFAIKNDQQREKSGYFGHSAILMFDKFWQMNTDGQSDKADGGFIILRLSPFTTLLAKTKCKAKIKATSSKIVGL